MQTHISRSTVTIGSAGVIGKTDKTGTDRYIGYIRENRHNRTLRAETSQTVISEETWETCSGQATALASFGFIRPSPDGISDSGNTLGWVTTNQRTACLTSKVFQTRDPGHWHPHQRETAIQSTSADDILPSRWRLTRIE